MRLVNLVNAVFLVGAATFEYQKWSMIMYAVAFEMISNLFADKDVAMLATLTASLSGTYPDLTILIGLVDITTLFMTCFGGNPQEIAWSYLLGAMIGSVIVWKDAQRRA